MDITYTTLEGCGREVEIRFPESELLPKFEKAYQESQPKLALKGFRKGKVPLHLIRRMFGEEIEHDTLHHLADEEFKRLAEEKVVTPVGAPELVSVEYKHGGDAAMKIRYEVPPEIHLADYHNLPVQRTVHAVTQAEVDAEIERQRFVESEMHREDEVMSDDYYVVVDAQKLDPQTLLPIIGENSNDARIYLKRATTDAELREGLMHKRVGDTIVIRQSEEGSEEKVPVSVTVKSIERVELPEVTPEFVKRATQGKTEDPATYPAFIRETLDGYWRDRSDGQVRDALADAYVRMHEFPVPTALVNELLTNMWEEYQRNYKQKLSKESSERIREMLKPTAIWKAQWMLIREALIKQENLSVEDSDVEALVEREHQKLGIEKDRLRNFYKTSEQAKEQIMQDKVFALLRDSAVFTDVSDTESKDPV